MGKSILYRTGSWSSFREKPGVPHRPCQEPSPTSASIVAGDRCRSAFEPGRCLAIFEQGLSLCSPVSFVRVEGEQEHLFGAGYGTLDGSLRAALQERSDL